MRARELDLKRVLQQLSSLRSDQILTDGAHVGGIVGHCMADMPEESKAHLQRCLEAGIAGFPKDCGSLALLILQVALNTAENPIYFDDLKAAFQAHLTPP